MSAVTRSRALKHLARRPPTAARSKKKPNHSARDWIWIVKATALAPREREAGGEHKAERLLTSRRRRRHSDASTSRPDHPACRSPLRFPLHDDGTSRLCEFYRRECKGREVNRRESKRAWYKKRRIRTETSSSSGKSIAKLIPFQIAVPLQLPSRTSDRSASLPNPLKQYV